MSATRVESPRLLDLRRMQPSPPFSALAGAGTGASAAPKPRACRKLFPVDHAETDRFLSEQLAALEREQRRKTGFDADRCRPLDPAASDPDPDDSCGGGGSRYTDWEAVPEQDVPAFYRETDSRWRRPLGPPSDRPNVHHRPSFPHPPITREEDSRRVSAGNSSSSSSSSDPASVPDLPERLRAGPAEYCPASSRRGEAFRPVPSGQANTTSPPSSPPSTTSSSRPSDLTSTSAASASTNTAHPTPSQDSSLGDGPRYSQAEETAISELPAKRQRSKEPSGATTQSTITSFYPQRKRNATSPTRAGKRSRPSATGEGSSSSVDGQS